MRLDTGEDRAREGSQRATKGANPLCMAEMYAFGVRAARTFAKINSNHLRDLHDEYGKYTTPNWSALGGVMKDLKKNGVIAPTDETVRSTRPGHHNRIIPVWRSLIY